MFGIVRDVQKFTEDNNISFKLALRDMSSEFDLYKIIQPPFDLSKLEITISKTAAGGFDPIKLTKDDDYAGIELDALIE